MSDEPDYSFLADFLDIWTWCFRYICHPCSPQSQLEVSNMIYQKIDANNKTYTFVFNNLTPEEQNYITQILGLGHIENSKLVLTGFFFRVFGGMCLPYLSKLNPAMIVRERHLLQYYYTTERGYKLLKYANKVTEGQLREALRKLHNCSYGTIENDRIVFIKQITSNVIQNPTDQLLGPFLTPDILFSVDEVANIISVEFLFSFFWKYLFRVNQFLSMQRLVTSQPEFNTVYTMLSKYSWPDESELEI